MLHFHYQSQGHDSILQPIYSLPYNILLRYLSRGLFVHRYSIQVRPSSYRRRLNQCTDFYYCYGPQRIPRSELILRAGACRREGRRRERESGKESERSACKDREPVATYTYHYERSSECLIKFLRVFPETRIVWALEAVRRHEARRASQQRPL